MLWVLIELLLNFISICKNTLPRRSRYSVTQRDLQKCAKLKQKKKKNINNTCTYKQQWEKLLQQTYGAFFLPSFNWRTACLLLHSPQPTAHPTVSPSARQQVRKSQANLVNNYGTERARARIKGQAVWRPAGTGIMAGGLVNFQCHIAR